jgi:hypothetical protein
MPSDLQPPPDAIPLLDAVERYVRLGLPNYRQRLKALCAFRRGWGTRTRELSWDDLSVWPEEDQRLWVLVAENFLTQWARKQLRVWGCDSDGGWHELSPVLGDSVLVTEVDWSRGIIFGLLGPSMAFAWPSKSPLPQQSWSRPYRRQPAQSLRKGDARSG